MRKVAYSTTGKGPLLRVLTDAADRDRITIKHRPEYHASSSIAPVPPLYVLDQLSPPLRLVWLACGTARQCSAPGDGIR